MAASSTCGPDCCILGAKRTKEARDAFLIYAVVWTGKSRVEKLWEKNEFYFRWSRRSSHLKETCGESFSKANMSQSICLLAGLFCALIWVITYCTIHTAAIPFVWPVCFPWICRGQCTDVSYCSAVEFFNFPFVISSRASMLEKSLQKSAKVVNIYLIYYFFYHSISIFDFRFWKLCLRCESRHLFVFIRLRISDLNCFEHLFHHQLFNLILFNLLHHSHPSPRVYVILWWVVHASTHVCLYTVFVYK